MEGVDIGVDECGAKAVGRETLDDELGLRETFMT